MRARLLVFLLPGGSSYKPSNSLQMVARTKMMPAIFSVFVGDEVLLCGTLVLFWVFPWLWIMSLVLRLSKILWWGNIASGTYLEVAHIDSVATTVIIFQWLYLHSRLSTICVFARMASCLTQDKWFCEWWYFSLFVGGECWSVFHSLNLFWQLFLDFGFIELSVLPLLFYLHEDAYFRRYLV